MQSWGEFRTGWKIVLSAAVGIGTSLTTLVFYSTGVLMPALSRAFGWSDPAIMASLTIVLLGASLLGPPIGLLADRIGSRPVVLASVALLGLAWLFMALNTGSLVLFYVLVVVLTVAGAGTLPVTWTRAVIRHFVHRRGAALGLCLVGTGVFGILVKQLSFHLLQVAGWRGAYAGIGALLLLVTWPIAWLGYGEPAAADAGRRLVEPGLELAQAARTRQFWTLVAGFFLLSVSIAGIAPNLERFLTRQGFGLAAAVDVASAYGLGIIVGRVLTGLSLDRFWAPAVIFVMLCPAVLTYVVLGHGSVTATEAGIAVFIVGSASGVEYDALSFLVARYFGRRAYSAIYGCIYIGFAVGAGLGPYVFTRMVGATGGYGPVMNLTALVLAAAILLLLTLGRYPARHPAPIAQEVSP